jgi:SAM-dependent methyltransferase
MTNSHSGVGGSPAVASAYYSITGRMPLASRLSLGARQKIFQVFMSAMAPTEATSILDLGVTCDVNSPESNFFEQFYPHKHRIVCAGTEPAHHLESTYPGTRFVQVTAGSPLPFGDGQFDIVFSNAVVEHAGSRAAQRAFIREALRVSRCFFLTTPNRWFPVELHTCLPLVHYLPPRFYRGIIRKLGHEYYASESNLNLLDRASLLALFPPGVAMELRRVRTLGLTSNLIVHGSN